MGDLEVYGLVVPVFLFYNCFSKMAKFMRFCLIVEKLVALLPLASLSVNPSWQVWIPCVSLSIKLLGLITCVDVTDAFTCQVCGIQCVYPSIFCLFF